MAKPYIHSCSSANKFGGKPEDYIEIHNFMDSSKGAMADSRHRALTHTSWFLSTILERVFGVTITNSQGRKVSVRDIGEQHILEDFGGKFIPSVQDYFEGMEFKEWMLRGHGNPPSYSKLYKKGKTMTVFDTWQANKEKARKAKEEAVSVLKSAFDERANELFAQFPELKSFAWTQYTPYFNDGDTCTFRAHIDELYVYMNNEEDGDVEPYYIPYNKKQEDYNQKDLARLAVKEFLSQFDDDDLYNLFNDHAKVAVSRGAEGAVIDIEEYSHD